MNDNRAFLSLHTFAASGRYSRRQIVRYGLGLGLSLGTVHRVLDATAQEAIHVPILDRMMTPDDVKAAIAQEGTVAVANWFYQASPQLVARFQQYVLDRFGASITLDYGTTLEPFQSYGLVADAVARNEPPPFDVIAIEENFWSAAAAADPPLATAFLPSGLIPNAERVLANLKHAPTGIAFQASAALSITYNSSRVDFLTDWKDLADPRLKGRLVIPAPGDFTSGLFLVGVSYSLGKDYTDLEQMKAVIDFAADQVAPNAAAQFMDPLQSQQLYLADQIDATLEWGAARIWQRLGRTEARSLVAASGQPMVNGYLWIPTGAPHPVLAQIFIDWRLSDDGQLPGPEWGIGEDAWLEYHEGLLGPSYATAIPDWIAADYYLAYPTAEQIGASFKTIDWTVYNRDVEAWDSYYAERLAL